MSALTWRNVDAPDFRASMEGYDRFSQLLGNAFGGLQRGIAGFEAEQDRQAEQAFAQKVASFGSSDELSAALKADPTLGFKAKRITPEVLQNADRRVNMLLGQEDAKLGIADKKADMAFETYTRDRTKGENTAMDNAKAIIGQAAALSANGDYAGAQKILSDNQSVIGALTADQQIGVLKTNKGFQKDNLDIDSAKINNAGGLLNNEMKSWEFTNAKNEYATDGQAQTIAMKIGNTSLTMEDAMASLRGLNIQDGRLYNRIVAGLTMQFGGSAESFASNMGDTGEISSQAGSTKGGSRNDPYNVVLGFGAYGTPPAPITQMSMGEVIDFGKQTLIPNSKKAGIGRDSRGLLGSSAQGAYQITQSTLQKYAPILFGKNWQNVKFTPQVQDQIAEAIFNDTKNGNLKNTWASLPDSRPGAYKNVPWSKMRNIIISNEIGTPTNTTPQRVAAVKTKLTTNSGGDPNTTKFRQFVKAGDTNKTNPEMADVLFKQFKNQSPAYYNDLIARVRKQAGVSAEVAAGIIADSHKQNHAKTIFGLQYGSDASGKVGGYYVNEKALVGNMKLYQNQAKGLTQAAVVQVDNAQVGGAVDLAQKKLATAQANLVKAQQLARSKPGVDLSRYETAVTQADAELDQALTDADNYSARKLNKREPLKKPAIKKKPVNVIGGLAF